MQAARSIGLQVAVRRPALAIARNSLALRSSAFARPAGPLTRTVTTKSLPASAARDVLDAQRLVRPSSPHFTIYQPQITWYASIINRTTGAALSGLLYAFSVAYLLGPVVGLPFDSTQIVEFVHGLPEWTKLTGKTLLAAPFAFHSWNGLRHLAWDATKLMSVKAVTRSGWAVVAVSAVSTVYLVAM